MKRETSPTRRASILTCLTRAATQRAVAPSWPNFERYRDTRRMVLITEPTPRFTSAHRWSFKNNAICGICLGQWLPLLWCFRAHVEWRAYWQRVAFVTVLAGLNSLLAAVEAVWHGRAIARQRIHPRPLFVLGHPRTGTTLLHSLLALDDELGTCSTFCAGLG